ncbi:MAG: filamentous hemagglutinin N-terminal domain-containing protein, partial [Halocynthiibacter sp.]
MTMITLKNFFLNAVRGVSIGLLVVQPVFAQATVVPAATGPAIVQAPNGVDVVQINTPNSTGVSHNTYDQFNVGPNGLILNNINSNFASTQLGGIIEGNSNLQEGAASVILNEVVGPNPSSLTGYLEVGGTRADVVVANPYGITCNGCGFINADRLTLTTGTPEFSGDHFTGVSVEDGKIAIGENGLDASDALRFDLISRQVDFAGTVKGQEINVVAGRNNVIYATGEIIKKAPNGTSPALSIDSTVLGGMYAGAISITSTEEGVGVKAPQNMSASTGGMTITADGRLVIGKASAKGPVRVKTTRDAIEVQTSLKGENGVEVSSAGDLLISADGRLVAGAAMVLNSGGATNLGTDAQVASAGALTVTALDAITLQGGAKLASYSDLLVTSATLSADEGAVIAAGVSSDTPNQGNLTLHVTDRVDLNGAMAAASGDVAVISKIVDIAASGGLPAGKFVAGKSAAFTLTQLHSQDATIRANEALSITGTSGMLSIDGAVVQAGGDVTLSAKALALTSDIQSIAGVLKIASSIGAISTSGTLLGQSVDIDSAGDFTNSGVVQGHSLVDIVAANMVNTGAVQSVDGAVNLTVDQLTTSDTVFGKTAVAIKAATSVSNSGNITSDGGITLAGTGGAPVLTNAKDATLIGNGDVALTLASLSNNGAIASQAGALQINATGAVTNDAFGVLYGHTSSTLKTDGIFTNTGGAVLASGNLTIAGLTNARAA